ncbi:MAG: RNA methyltransferase [Thermodesulfobacteriaceae bacterium]|nr:RNA methyltransferase [Thermodesulfobacteriaceae bacterium]MCX8042145.1 RNA methyltransferase [Thermodesulfobacteriaceae bacterium]MDW8136324.1 RNA methyltransferase [Thermodesulfobacterium sp.]
MIKKLEGEDLLIKWRKYRPSSRFPMVAVLDNIRSAYNVGSIFRTAECAYISKIILCGITPLPHNPKVEKTALGTNRVLPWEYFEDTLLAIKNLKKEGYQIGVLEITNQSLPIQSLSYNSFPLALVLGNEVTGVEERILREADFTLEIPLYGEKESLNVAVAFGVAIFLLIEKLRNHG